MTVDEQTRGGVRPEPSRSRSGEERMRALHRATLSLYADLSLESTLHRIVEAAQDLAEATYAAIGVVNRYGALETFITAGMTLEDESRIPRRPTGQGLIGEMMRSGRSIRLPDLTRHPSSVGFPPHHPPMRSFLGIPVAAYGRPIGQIYLTDKRNALEFTEEDQNLIELLAAHAAAAIENARLYQAVQDREDELRQRNEELELSNALTSTGGTAGEVDRLLESILGRILELFGAQAGEIYLRLEDTRTFDLSVQQGLASKSGVEPTRFRVGEGLIGRVAETKEAYWTDRLESEPNLESAALVQAGFRTMVCIPLAAHGNVLGVLTLAFLSARPMLEREIRLLTAIGGGVGIVLENARLLRQAQRLAVLEERERIAMDLHDGIIQSIYAVGLSLDSARLQATRASHTKEDAALDRAIDGLNAIIRDIRSYILDLQPSRIPADDLGEALRRLLDEFRANSLMDAELILDPDAAQTLAPTARIAAFHIAQEAVANVAKHSRAKRAWVTLRWLNDGIGLQVIDNGEGFDSAVRAELLGHGLSNMASRARAAGGELEIVSNPGEGTTVTARFPFDPDGRQAAQNPVSVP
ncbi:MAG TPA: GAF domain-containing sensor histidine kinase [Anaerolineales bacterium]|nr:GAF domain-containing sensor histidine kinase [Anaerolineales bacterium]